jgi:hypothetical protein
MRIRSDLILALFVTISGLVLSCSRDNQDAVQQQKTGHIKGASEWHLSPGPHGGDVKDLISVGDKLYVLVGNAIYRFDPKKNSWKMVYSDPSDYLYTIISWQNKLFFSNPEGVFELTRHNNNIYQSRKAQFPDLNTEDVMKGVYPGQSNIVVDYQETTGSIRALGANIEGDFWKLGVLSDGEDLYLEANGVLKLDRESGAWKPMEKGLPVRHIPIDSTTIDTNVLVAGEKHLYTSIRDHGIFEYNYQLKTWEKRNEGMKKKSVESLAIHDGDVFAGTREHGVFHLESKRWKPYGHGLNGKEISHLVMLEKNFYAGTDEGVYHYNAHSHKWQLRNQGLLGIAAHCLLPIDNHLYICTDYGVFQWSEQTQGWQSFIKLGKVTALEKNNEHLFIGTKNGGFFKAKHHSNKITVINKGLPKRTHLDDVLGSGGAISYLLGMSCLGEDTDACNGLVSYWSAQLSLSVETLFSDGADIYAGTNNGVFVLKGGVEPWSNISPPETLGSEKSGSIFHSLFMTSDYLYAGTNLTLLRKERGTDQWEIIDNRTHKILLGNSKSLYVVPYGQIYRRSYKTNTWRGGITMVVAAAAMVDEVLYLVEQDTWKLFRLEPSSTKPVESMRISDYPVNDILISGPNIFVATKHGVHMLKIDL